MTAEQPDSLSAAFEALNAARKESIDERARNLQTSRDRKSHFDSISTEIIMPTQRTITNILKSNDCDVMSPREIERISIPDRGDPAKRAALAIYDRI